MKRITMTILVAFIVIIPYIAYNQFVKLLELRKQVINSNKNLLLRNMGEDKELSEINK